MGILDRIVNIAKGPLSMLDPSEGYRKAGNETQKYWQQALGFQQPFMEAGKSQLPMLTGAENQLLNPADLLGKWMGSYETSPYAKRSMQNAQSAGLDAASSMGLGGSSAALGNIQQSSSDIMNKDRDTFLNDLMQKYMTGIGVGQDIYGKGVGTAGNLGKEALGVGQDMAGAAYGEENSPADIWRNLLAMGSKMYMQNKFGGTGANA